MAIAQTKYINIVSSVGGESSVSQRDLMGRVFTTNYLVPAGTVLEFTGGSIGALESIGAHFGTTSAEYTFAAKYFQPTKTGTVPQKISFARHAATAVAATLIGTANPASLATLQAMTNGTLSVVVNGVAKSGLDINLTTAGSFADVASKITEAIADGATCIYDAEHGRFVLQTVATGAGQTLDYATGTIADALGWTTGTGILSDGADASTALQTVIDSAALSNNFFSFCFLGNDALTQADIKAIAEWNSAQNVRYLFSVAVAPANAEEVVAAVKSYSGTILTLDKFDADAQFMPMSRFAAVDYTKPNAAISMDYQQFTGVEPSVLSTAEASKWDALRVNYYGATAQAGQTVAFYQDGLLQGSITDAGVYANEAWLKDAIFTSLLNLRLALDSLPANNTGLSLVAANIAGVINAALFNGTIQPGKTLDATQKAYITQLTGDTDAWLKVATGGYYLDYAVEQYTEGSAVKYKVSYLLVYGKGDSINYIDGRDIMI